MYFSVLFCLLPLIAFAEEHEGYDPTGGVSETKKLNFVDTYKAPSCSMETQENDKIHWHYKGTLLNGHVFDEGNFNAQLGHRQVITGVDKGMRGLCVGDKRKMTIHYDWAYGERGVPGTIPPNSHLVFEVELLSIDRPGVGKVTKDDIAASAKTTTEDKSDVVEDDGGVSKENKLKIHELYQINREHCKLLSEVNDKISYTFDGFFLNGTEFESGNFTNTIGNDEVIIGFEKGLLDMCVGDERELVIHPDWAYGEEGVPEDGIPANATLIYDMQLIRIEKPDGRIIDFEDVKEFIPENTDDIIDNTETTNDTTTNDDVNSDDNIVTDDVDNIVTNSDDEGEVDDKDDGKLKIENVFKADGEKCSLISEEKDKIRWCYKGTLLNGKIFDKGEYATTLGSHGVILGVDKGMRGMCVGDKRKMTIHSDWAYGDRGVPPTIPPKATLIFDVELLYIDRGNGEKAFVNQTLEDTFKSGKCNLISQEDDSIHWIYKGLLLDGTVFDEGRFDATLGHGDVIDGVDQGMRGLCVGDKRTMTMHSDLGYGDEGTDGIPPKATLIFEVELLEIKRPDGEIAIHYPIDPNTGMTEGQLLKIDVLQPVEDCTIKSQADDTIYWHYKGTFLDGTEFHTGDFHATIGKGHVITGVDKGMRGMCVGEKRRLTIHSDWAYGDEGREGSIPPKATLVFDVEMQKIDRPKEELKVEL